MTTSLQAKKTWQSVTTETDEIWQTKLGVAHIDTGDAPLEGILLHQGNSIQFKEGTTIYYKKTGDSPVIIARIGV